MCPLELFAYLIQVLFQMVLFPDGIVGILHFLCSNQYMYDLTNATPNATPERPELHIYLGLFYGRDSKILKDEQGTITL